VRQLEHVAEEVAVGIGLRAVNDRVGANQHAGTLP
jgi:hypothetical protein